MEQFLRESGFIIQKGSSLPCNRNTVSVPDYLGIFGFAGNCITVRCFGHDDYKGSLAKITVKFTNNAVWRAKVCYGDLPNVIKTAFDKIGWKA